MTPAALREAVATAISDATLDWCGDTPEIWDSHRMAADAAIAVVREAMREPDTDMIMAAPKRVGTAAHENGAETLYHGIYRAMLDASPLREDAP